VPPPALNIMAIAADAAVVAEELRADVTSRLNQLRGALGSEGLAVTIAVAAGDADVEIAAHARAVGADLIIMGAHSRPTLERFLLGSVAERTVRRATCPVLIIPPGVDQLGPTGDSAAPLKIVLALDGRSAGEGAIAFVRALCARLRADVTCLRFYWPVEEYARLGLTGPRDPMAHDPEVVADLERTLRLGVGVLPGTGKTTFQIEPTWGDPAGRILDVARDLGADLVVMGGESRHGLASLAHPPVAARVARRASGVPVIFVPQPTRAAAPNEIRGLFTVLVATDLSPDGNRAIPYAYGLLAPRGGVVELCHVHERSLPSPPYAYASPEGQLDPAARARLVAALRALVPADAERLGITTHVTIVDGGAAGAAIVQASERLVADAIVIGSHGKGGLRRALLGSVSEEVMRRARRPVLIVPVPGATSDGP
jgi:nucleotide-binding universal stress UspA family protein